MAARILPLSLDELRDRYLRGGEAVPASLLARLRRDPRQGAKKLYTLLERKYEKARGERQRLDALLNFERVLWQAGIARIAGVDESGMGPMAGPVVAAAVVFAPDTVVSGVDDSKRLDADERARLAVEIRARAAGIGIGLADVAEIDTVNVHQAGLLAMRRAVEALPEPPEHVLVDARTIPGITARQNRFNRGDGLSYSIAAASIIAKTHRDALMEDLDRQYPGYGLGQHKGYCTAAHQAAVRALGPSPAHRLSFLYIRELTGELSARFYDLKTGLDAALTPDTLREAEARIDEALDGLGEYEQRKLRLMLARRWRHLAEVRREK